MILSRFFCTIVLALCIQTAVYAQVSISPVQEDIASEGDRLNLEMFEDMNIEDIDILFDIARSGSIGRIQEVIDLGWGVNFLDESGKTFFMHAASDNSAEAVRYILDAAAEIDKKTVFGWTALMYAARDNSLAVVEVLLENGADASIKNSDGDTASMLASIPGVAEYLKDNGFATVTIKSEPSNIPVNIHEFDISGWTPLTVEVPLNKEFSVSADERDGYTGLSVGGYEYEDKGPHTIELVLEPIPQKRVESQETQQEPPSAATPTIIKPGKIGANYYILEVVASYDFDKINCGSDIESNLQQPDIYGVQCFYTSFGREKTRQFIDSDIEYGKNIGWTDYFSGWLEEDDGSLSGYVRNVDNENTAAQLYVIPAAGGGTYVTAYSLYR